MEKNNKVEFQDNIMLKDEIDKNKIKNKVPQVNQASMSN
jgi:hypothetical protein